jgi:hypothetical protein
MNLGMYFAGWNIVNPGNRMIHHIATFALGLSTSFISMTPKCAKFSSCLFFDHSLRFRISQTELHHCHNFWYALLFWKLEIIVHERPCDYEFDLHGGHIPAWASKPSNPKLGMVCVKSRELTLSLACLNALFIVP